MELTITNCDEDGRIDARMVLRLVCTFTRENGVLYENWDSPDFPLPQPMISEILTFLERHVCAPVSADQFIRRAEVPASLVAKLMGPAWMSRFRQLTSRSAPVKQLPAVVPIDVEAEAVPPTPLPGPTGLPG